MDSFHFHKIKMEKANAKLRHRRLHKITAMFRLMEFCILLIIVSRFTVQLPVAFKLSGEYFRGFSVTAVSPGLVFILGNAIVLVLFLKSGHPSAKNGDTTVNSKLDLYDEYVKINSEKNPCVYKEENTACKKQRKQSGSTCVGREVAVSSDAHNSRSDNTKERKVKIQRSQSENLKRAVQQQQQECAGRELRRLATVKCRGHVDNEEKPAVLGSSYKEDEMSNEEFRRTVEAFIARQQRALREEEEFAQCFLRNL